MTPYIKRVLLKEALNFKRLSLQAQKLIISIVFYNFADPILFIFVNAYLFRETKDIESVAWYMIANYAGLPIGFFINGFLLKKYNPTRLFLIGNISRGICAVLLIFIGNITYISILTFGFLSGISGGLHWANRNYFGLLATKSDNRIYFSTLDNASNIITSIIVPLFIGWFIVFGSSIQIYSPIIAYHVITLLALLILIISGLILKDIAIPFSQIKKNLHFNTSSYWLKIRIFNTIHGLLDGMRVVIPIIIALTFLGNEEILGTTQSYMALLSAIAVYVVGKVIMTKQRLLLLAISLLLTGIGSLIFSFTFSVLGVLFYITLQALADPFNQVCFTSISYDAMDREERKTKIHHYCYILDQEIFHNIGRVSGILLFILFIHLFSNTFALRFTPIIFAASQVFFLFITRNIEKTNHYPSKIGMS